MQTPTPPAVGLASDYIESYAAETGCPERELWRAVLRQAGDDLFSSDEQIRQDAANFFLGPDLLDVMDMAGIDPDLAPAVGERALAICQESGRSRRRRGITYQGKTRTYREWSRVTGLTMDTIVGRL